MPHLHVTQDPEHVLLGGGDRRPVLYPDPVLLLQADPGLPGRPQVTDVVEARPVPRQDGGGALHSLASPLPALVQGKVPAVGAQFVSWK